MKNHKLAIFIGIILFIVPFFWLKPGEMNLGGDSGRLYFYDPYSFLKNYTLYNFIASGKGVESIGYVFSSYTFVLFLLKFIFKSPTMLIAIFNGLIVSTAFLSVYFIVRELLGIKEFSFKEKIINYSSILAGFFYIFSQELMNGGWANPIVSHNQLFLNPLIFLLLLKYLLTKNNVYAILALLISVIFATNFSYVGAPTFFSFYPLSLLFLFIYVRYIRRLSISYKSVVFGIFLFLLLHAFHLFPELSSVFLFSSAVSKTVFSVEGISSRGGLDYFIAIAASTKVTLSWMSLNQSQNNPWLAVYIVMPLVLLGGFYFNKGKTFLLSGIFFLIVLFLATANITDVGLSFYKLLFRIPGFSMFRNFHGQWVYVFTFFYTILFGQAVAIVASRLGRRSTFIFLGSFFVFILLFSISFLNGSIPIPTYKDSGLRYAFRMDPMYEKVLDFYKTDPIDGKTISFPFTGPGYQILQGLNGGVYQGLPIVSYVAGKGDFAGYGSLNPYDNIFLEYMKEQDFGAIKKLFSIMNIKYVFYNSDPFIYSDVFTGYLYAHVSEYAPKSQEEYKSFVESLPVGNRIDFGDKYHVYSVNTDTFLPHIFTTSDVVYTNDQLSFTTNPYFNDSARTVSVSMDDPINKDSAVLYGSTQTFLSMLTNNSHLHRHAPFISHALDDMFYGFVPLKEKFDLYRLKDDPMAYFDRSMLHLSKRIFEMQKFGETAMPIIKKTWKQPELWEIYRLNSYNSWEASISRYQSGTEDLIDLVGKSSDSIVIQEANRIKINEQLFRHQIELVRFIRNMNRKKEEKEYIYSITNKMFEGLFQKVNIPIYNPSEYYYDLPDYPGEYTVFLGTNETIQNIGDANISINNKKLRPLQKTPDNNLKYNLLQFDNYSFKPYADTNIVLNIPAKNLAKDTRWENSGSAIGSEQLLTFDVNNNIGENTKGLMLDIPEWQPNTSYLISFDYLTDGDDFVFSFYDKKETADVLRQYVSNLVFEKILNSKTWKVHQSIVNSEGESLNAFLQITAFSQKNISRMHMKNLSITKIKYPTVLFKKIPNDLHIDSQPPQITFTKINPSKYLVHVTGAKNPYGLVFLGSFNNNWKIIDSRIEDKTIIGSTFRFIGSIGRSIVGLFIKDDIKQNKIVATYFNGDVQEGTHKNIFLAPSTFESWGKHMVAEDKHSKTLEYANAWIIDPEDMQGRSEYTLIIEMYNNNNFYIFGFISVFTFISLLVYSIKKRISKHEKNN